MDYSVLINGNGKDHYKVVDGLVAAEVKNHDTRVFVYAPSNATISTEVASTATVIPASKVVLPEIFNVLLGFDTIRCSGILDTPKDLVLIIPECDRYLRYVPAELVQTLLNRLAYLGVRLIFISDGGIATTLTYESVRDAED